MNATSMAGRVDEPRSHKSVSLLRLLLVFLTLGIPLHAAVAQSNPPWVQVASSGPSENLDPAVAYDAARGRMVLFGDYYLRSRATWEWDGNSWTLRATTGPSPRWGHAMAYDSTRKRVVLFGGFSASSNYMQDTWEWDGSSWTLRSTTGPSGRNQHAMAYDSVRKRTVLVSGLIAPGTAGADTWEWDGSTWERRATGSPGYIGTPIAFDSTRGRVVMFYVGNTWEWDGSAWSHKSSTGPSQRYRNALAFDGERARVVLFGGWGCSNNYCGPGNPFYSDTWEWDGTLWVQRASTGPAGRGLAAMAYDSARGRVVLFGGSNYDQEYSDTWELPSGIPQVEALEPSTPGSLLVNGGSPNYNTLGGSNAGTTRTGLAADGATRLLLRWEVPGSGTITWSIKDENGSAADVGSLSQPGSTSSGTTMSASPKSLSDGRKMAFAVMKAPNDFARNSNDYDKSSRELRINASFTPSGGGASTQRSLTLQLRRPPVVLLHGLWSDKDTWDWPLQSDTRFSVTNHDYSANADKAFGWNSGVAASAVEQAVKSLRQQGIAATRVDFIGHSMGGLLGRFHVADSNYKSVNNYDAGEFHKLITVDTPHAGSPLANLLVSSDNETTLIGSTLRPVIAAFVPGPACMDCGAVWDLRTDSGHIVSRPAANVPSHAIVGRGGSDLFEQAALHYAPPLVRALVEVLEFFDVIDSIFPPALQHDIVVGRSSQEGGLNSSQTSLFGLDLLANPPGLGVHFSSVTVEDRVGNRVIELLNKRVGDSSFASGFPAGTGRGEPGPELRLPRQVSVGLTITSPQPGALVAPGTPITVEVQALSGFQPVRVLVVGPENAIQDQAAPFSATFDLPAGVIGDVTLQAVGVDANGVYFTSNAVVVVAQPVAALTGIAVQPSEVWLSGGTHDFNLTVQGTYSDGVTRTLTGAGLGTIYQSSDPNVAAVDAGGLVTAINDGTAVIDVGNGAFSATSIVHVAIPPPAPAPFGLLTPAEGATIPTTTPTLQWSASQEASDYTVQIDDQSDFSSPEVDQSASAVTSLNVASGVLSNNTWYHWRVTANNAVGSTGSTPAVASFLIVLPPPCLGDASGDRTIDFADITAVLASWGTSGPIGDANHDGHVDFVDISQVLVSFGSSCP